MRVAGGLGPDHLQLAPRGCVCEARAPLSTGALRRDQEPVHHPCREPNATTPRAGSRSGDRSVTTRWRVPGEFRSGWMVDAMPGCVWGWLRPSRAFGSTAGQAGGPGQGRAGRSCAVSGPPAGRGQVWHQPSRMSRMPKTQTLAAEPQLLNRELSWLDFNERVLELADDESVPLLERVKFCAIFSSMLDEFFMVRVAGLLDQAESGLSVRSPDGLTPREALAAIRPRVEELVMNQSRLWRKRLVPALAAEGITVAHVDDCSDGELDELKRRFEREIFPVLTPLARQPGPAVPVHLAALAEPRRARPRPGLRRGALRAREGPGGAAALPRARPAPAPAPARGRDRALPRRALPGDGDPRAGGLPRHPRRRPRALRRRRRPARGRPAPRSAGGASATSCASRSPRRCRRR